MAGGAEVTPLAGEGQQILVIAILALHAGKPVVQVAAVPIPVMTFWR